MRLEQVRRAWVVAWLAFAALAACGTWLSRWLAYDPFLAERYLSLLICAPFVALVVLHRGFRLRRQVGMVAGCMALTLMVAVSSGGGYFAPLVYFAFIAISVYAGIELQPVMEPRHWLGVRRAFLVSLAVLSALWVLGDASSFQLGNRFVGFFASPTTFSTWLTALLLVSYPNSTFSGSVRDRMAYAMVLLLSAGLIYASGTRTNLIFVALLAGSGVLGRLFARRTVRAAAIALAILAVGFAYPMYDLLQQTLPEGLMASRYEGGEDASAGLRIALFDTVLDSYLSGDARSLVLGQGAESSRLVVMSAFGSDLLPHNDVMRVLHDFGPVLALAFALGLAVVGSRTYLATVLSLLYVTSFMHNMVYSHYLGALILLTAGLGTLSENKHGTASDARDPVYA